MLMNYFIIQFSVCSCSGHMCVCCILNRAQMHDSQWTDHQWLWYVVFTGWPLATVNRSWVVMVHCLHRLTSYHSDGLSLVTVHCLHRLTSCHSEQNVNGYGTLSPQDDLLPQWTDCQWLRYIVFTGWPLATVGWPLVTVKKLLVIVVQCLHRLTSCHSEKIVSDYCLHRQTSCHSE